MHAVTGAKDHAAGNPFVRLGDVEAALRHFPPGAVGETPVTRRPPAEQPGIGRIAGDLPEAFTRRPVPTAGDESHLGPLAGQRAERPLDEALRPAVGVVALTDDGDLHRASSSWAASSTASTLSEVRQSLTLPPPQPSIPHGRQGCCWLLMTRNGTPHGPHCLSPDGPNKATVGVPTAAAICIGAESTPMNSFAARV